MADIKRLNYFDGQFLREADFSVEQEYQLGVHRDHQRLFHTEGVADGLEVTFVGGGTAVTVHSGVAYDDLGRRMVLSANKVVELSGLTADAMAYVTIAYAEEPTDVSD